MKIPMLIDKITQYCKNLGSSQDLLILHNHNENYSNTFCPTGKKNSKV